MAVKVADTFIAVAADLKAYKSGLKEAEKDAQTLGQQIRTALRDPAGFAGKSAIGGLISDLKLGRPLAASLGGALKGLSGGLTTGLNALHSVGTRVFGALRSLASNVFKGIALGVGIGTFLGVEQVVSRLTQLFPELINRGKSWAEAIHTITLETGASAEAASKQAAIYTFLGGTTDQYATQVVRLAARIKANEAVLNAYGVATRNANGDTLDQITLVDNLRHVMSKLPDGADKTALAFKLFGQRGAAAFGPLLHFLGLTDQQVSALGGDVTKQGLVISDTTTKIADGVALAQNRFQNAITGLATQLFTILGPGITSFFDSLSETITKNAKQIADTLASVGNTVLGFVEGLLGLAPALESFSKQFTRIDEGGANTTATLVALTLQLNKLQAAFDPTAGTAVSRTKARAAIEAQQNLIAKEQERIAQATKRAAVEVAGIASVTDAISGEGGQTAAFETSRLAGVKFAADFKAALVGTDGKSGVLGAIGAVAGALGHVLGLLGDIQRLRDSGADIVGEAAKNPLTSGLSDLLHTARGEKLPPGFLPGSGEKAADQFMSSLVGNLGRYGPALHKAATDVADAVPDAITAEIPRARQAMLDLLHAVAEAVTKGREGLDSEITKINDLAKKPTINATRELQNLLKARTAPLLLELLKSPDLQKRTAARALAADLDSIIAKAKPRPGIMSATSKALVADLKTSTNTELKAFAGWFEAQLNPQLATLAADREKRAATLLAQGLSPAEILKIIGPKPAAPATTTALHGLLKGALDSADPFLRNDAQNEGLTFAAAMAAGIADPQSKTAAERATETFVNAVVAWLRGIGRTRILSAWHDLTTGLTFDLPTFLAPNVARPGFATSQDPIRDSGGPVWANRPFLKNANQLELIVPKVDANILTLGQFGTMLNGRSQPAGPTAYTQVNNIDTINLADANDEMSIVARLRFLALAQG